MATKPMFINKASCVESYGTVNMFCIIFFQLSARFSHVDFPFKALLPHVRNFFDNLVPAMQTFCHINNIADTAHLRSCIKFAYIALDFYIAMFLRAWNRERFIKWTTITLYQLDTIPCDFCQLCLFLY